MLKEYLLRMATYHIGMPRVVNGLPLRVASPTRARFTPEYDAGLSAFLRRHVAAGMEVWNVGANVGIHTLQLASWVGPAGRVVAFEPNPAAARLLGENLTLNGLRNRVEVIPAAVGARDGRIDLYVSGADGMARVDRPNPLLARPSAVTVDVMTLDSFVAGRDRVPEWIVMDIEGWEIPALRGARTLWNRTRFAAELHPWAWPWSGESREAFEALLAEAGLTPIPMAGQTDALSEHGQVVFERAARSLTPEQ